MLLTMAVAAQAASSPVKVVLERQPFEEGDGWIHESDGLVKEQVRACAT